MLDISDLILDNVCKRSEDSYQIAFYNVNDDSVRDEFASSLFDDSAHKFVINDLELLNHLDMVKLPDVLIVSERTQFTDREVEILKKLDVKVYYFDLNVLDDEDLENKAINKVERIVFKSRMLKNFAIMDKRIGELESLYNNEEDNDIVIEGLIDGVLNLIKDKDEVTYSHVSNVSKYVDIYLDGLSDDEKLSESEIQFLKRAALVHDIGKLVVPTQILRKPSRLSDAEFSFIKDHVGDTSFLFHNELMEQYKDIALCHHERFDGRGYPNGLKGENIPHFARILSVLDTFEALTGKREYVKKQPSRSLDDVLDILVSNSGTQFDPHMVDTFIGGVRKNPEFTDGLTEEKGGILKCA